MVNWRVRDSQWRRQLLVLAVNGDVADGLGDATAGQELKLANLEGNIVHFKNKVLCI